ncbi:MAG: M3 family metallopeptidase [bacterium]
MKKILLMFICTGFILLSCSKSSKNPFLKEFQTPFEIPPFDQIKTEHYIPAIKKGIDLHNQEIEEIVNNSEEPTFKNTLVALEKSGSLLRKTRNVFYVLNSSMSDKKMQEIDKKITPMLSNHQDDILLNEKLFERIKAINDKRENLDLSTEQNTLVEEYYKDFVRGGANLSKEKKEELRKINEKLSVLSVEFGEHILKENNKFELVIEDEKNLEGLPQSVRDAAANAAQERGYENKWVFTLHRSSITPFLTYSNRRDLREKIFKGYINRGNNNNELDNKDIVSQIVSLRVKRANLLGYKTHAHYILEENMAKNPDNVFDLLDKIWKPGLEKAKKEAGELQQIIYDEGKDFTLQPWDWWFYAEKLKQKKYALSDEQLKPYFELEQVRNGIFYLAKKLYGINFVERKDLPRYHEDVKVYEVEEADGTHIGIFYTDYFSRSTKRGGAWMNSFRKQSNIEENWVGPIITNNLNLAKPSEGQPTLLTLDQVNTMFHEFGHGLHGLLSNCTYRKLSGTSVARDFVELPSQIMEHWVTEPELLKVYAKHYETDEVIPSELVDKIKKAGFFNQGFATVEYLSAAFLDMFWHTLTEPEEKNVLEFEDKMMDKIGLISEIVVRYRSPYFSHVFSGGYSAGYYSYIWSEVLDCDAFHAFKEKSIFDKETALSFRENILEKGGSEDPMVLYKRFRGSEPDVKYLLQKRGLE